MDQPRLTGDKIYLRPIADSDLDGPYLQWLNDSDITRYLEVGPPQTHETLTRYLARFEESDTDFIFAICDRDSDQHIGNITLNHINRIHGTADSGIMIGAKDCWGKGYAYDAWCLVLDYAFSQLGLRKIIAGCVADNLASLKLQEKLGFRLEGTFRDEVMIDGEFHDVKRLGIFREDFRQKRG